MNRWKSPKTEKCFENIWQHSVFFFFFFFFLNCLPVFSHTAFYGTFRSAAFSITIFLFFFAFTQVMRRGSGALSPATHAHSTSHSQTYTTFTDIHNIHRHTQHLYTHGRLFPTGLEPVLTSPWWPKEC
jgi:hypothetical protein